MSSIFAQRWPRRAVTLQDSYKRFADGAKFTELVRACERKFGPNCQAAVLAENVCHRVLLWTKGVKVAIEVGRSVKNDDARADWCEAMLLAWSEYIRYLDEEPENVDGLLDAYLRITRLHRWGMDLVGGRDGVLANIEADKAPLRIPLRIPDQGMAVLGLKTKTMGWKDNDLDRYNESQREVRSDA